MCFRDIKKAKYETRKLEHEGKKMEERLQELKMAMNREKEEREYVYLYLLVFTRATGNDAYS